MTSEKKSPPGFDYTKILYPIIVAIVLAVVGFTTKTVVVSRSDVQEQELKKEIKSIERDILEMKTDHEKDIKKIESDIQQLKEQTVSVDRFEGLSREIQLMNESLKLIERRTYDIWKAEN